jgi:photosystem II stability/assembly factor-like uncharacterized protein
LSDCLPDAVEVRYIAVARNDPETIYAGTQLGPYRSTDSGQSWTSLNLPRPERVVWSILLHPDDPEILYVGTEGSTVFRTDDGGESWRQLPTLEPAGLVSMAFPTRLVRMALDPSNPDEVYAGLEVGGLIRSLDGGRTWEDCNEGLLRLAEKPHLKSRIGSDTDVEGMMDTHAMAVSKALPGTVFFANRMGLFRSADRGTSWEEMDIGRFSELTYARDVQVSPNDPKTLYAALSAAAVSDAGSLYRSQDLGQTWSRFDHGVAIVSTLMIIATSRLKADRVYCAARRGQVFGTEDGGNSWREFPLPAGVEGVYALACA